MSASRFPRIGSSRLGRRLARGIAAACLASITAGLAAGVPTAAAAGAPHVQATQELAVLLSAHAAHRAPEANSPQVALVAASRPITGEPTTLPVLSRSIAAGGRRWLRVTAPRSPQRSERWIAEQGTSPSVTAWSIVVDLAARRVPRV